MDWHEQTDHPFAGIAQRLKRTDENIANLANEIARFFDSCKYPVIPETQTQEWQDATDYHKSLAIPLRFSVLSGEIVHHLRSCLDNVAWHFSSVEYRRDHETSISFPISLMPPITPKELAGYERKIKGISNTRVRKIIDSVQPYHRGDDALDDPLCIVHDMDRFDKHRDLTIIGSVANLRFLSVDGRNAIALIHRLSEGQKVSPEEAAIAYRAIKKDVKVSPQVAFSQFGKRNSQIVVPALAQLLHAVSDVIDLFAAEV